MENTKKWIRIINNNQASKMNLICFPYAGSSASYYFQWKELFPDFNLYGVQYPLRENRQKDTMLRSIQEIAVEIVQDNETLFRDPFILFGHSLGGIISYEVACAVKRIWNKQPNMLFISGSLSPQDTEKMKKTSNLSKDEFLKVIEEYEGTPRALFEDAAFEEYYLPILREDFWLLERYRYKSNEQLNCPIECFFGDKDTMIDRIDTENWNTLTSNQTGYHYFNGNHFFIDEYKAEISSIMKECIF